MLTLEDLYKKIFNQFHKTRLTHEFYLRLDPEEVNFLLSELLWTMKERDLNTEC